MTNYTKTTDFAAKDALPSGNSAKIVKGSEIDTEFNNIATASATKANANDAALTGTTTFETISDGTIAITAFVDEDNMASDSATLLPTQQSVKAYVDSQVTAQDLDVTDGSSTIDIDLDSESLGILGGTGIDSTASGTGVTLAIDATVATLAGTQTLTNKTLTSPTLNTPTIGTSFTIGSATITEAELEILDGATVTTNELNVLDGVTSTTAELNILDGVTSTAAELNILDGVTATTTELNYVDGVTSAIQTQIDAKAALAGANFTGDVDVAGTLTTDSFSIEDATSPTLTLNDTTSANQKTTLSHTVGASVLTTGDNGVFGSFKVAAFDGTSTINRLLIADNGDVSLYEAGGVTAKLVWDSSAEALEFADNAKATFGAGDDLQIFHNGTDSFIREVGTGGLKIDSNGPDLTLRVNATESAIVANSNGSVDLYYDNTLKLATTSTGIDVTGTVTASSASDALVRVSDSTNANQRLDLTHNAGVASIISGNNGAFGTLKLQAYNGTDTIDRFRISSNGDINLGYEDTGTTPKLFWDSSAESLGIGTSSPSRTLDIQGTGDTLVSIVSPAANQAALFFGDTDSDSVGRVAYDNSDNSMRLNTNGSEAMRIDSSQNLLVGKTATAVSSDGIEARNNGLLVATRDNNKAAILNRRSSDGDILEFNKDSAAVGSIGVNSDRIYLSGASEGVYIDTSLSAFSPCTTSGGNFDDHVDLGGSSSRFKDLYLSGGAYLGGTGSANKLDDYEEGSWTPAADFSTTSPTSGATTGTGRYVKVGNLVTVWATVPNFNVTGAAGNLNLTGLPFTTRLEGLLQRYVGAVRINNCDFSNFTNPIQVNSQVLDSSSLVTISVIRDDAGSDAISANALNDGVSDIQITLTYETSA